ncbi:proline--tRNA ligase [Fervidicoccus fontis]|uniref:Proline--tRNA ligase n=2 Tax=Fervidicoccus fontis TaxID=683846 RepID=I0A1R8_FERFK|nr:prolyl-tRNA synthetase [Fervidicoccus fontis Kam940]MBE9391517.1 proline--tRNA ligase [Fervidicoccus fontis]PMB77189.1 MAG: proline--tRNA ligase [Fervidicoccus fontis]HEW64368.1 proline--tRNA ligase [Fervidicoccus fontis]
MRYLDDINPEEFSEWFDTVIKEAEIYDYGRYPVKGMGVWMPYGFALRKNIIELIRKEHDSKGHEEILLPLLIPEDLLIKEEEHIRGFRDEVYWVTHGGLDELDVKLALRPTSETSISLMESYWLNSYKQLPKKFYQIVSIFRYETKATRAMIRLREVSTFKEAHTAHSTFEDADRQVREAIEIYSTIFDQLGIPYVISKRPDFDKFAGALYTIAFDTVMPDGKVLQVGTVHHLGQNFSKSLDVKVLQENGENDYVWQTSYGLSDRVIASTISIHGDKRGLILPYIIAPIKVVIIPIYFNDEEKKGVIEYSEEIRNELENCGIRTVIDTRTELTPGKKFYDWELRGVPIRLEIGKREISSKTVVIVTRDELKKKSIAREKICESVRKEGEEIDKRLRERAKKKMEEKISKVEKLELTMEYGERVRGIIEVPWCGSEDCALKIQERTGIRVLGSPIEKPEWIKGKTCPVCGRNAVTSLRLAKTY